jgi:16S rRNA (cytosine1402-N4)-methyltransferase
MAMTPTQHKAVLLQESIEALNIIPNGIYLDGTFGRGGHSQEILARLNENGRLLCFDKDPQAIAHGKAMMGQDNRVQFFQECFSDMYRVIKNLGLLNQLNGILLDLGVSSPQLEEPERGFSFMRDGPLDMRMDPTRGLSAKDWLNSASSEDIIWVLRKYGEESFAKRIAHRIVESRVESPLNTTLELAKLVTQCVPFKKIGHHPATKTFQAIRIYINQELQSVETVLNDTQQLLGPLGRLAIISFHSLEDRMVKQFFRHQSKVDVPKGIAVLEKDLIAPFQWVIKRQRPSMIEIENNPRSRSATLRCLEKQGTLISKKDSKIESNTNKDLY